MKYQFNRNIYWTYFKGRFNETRFWSIFLLFISFIQFQMLTIYDILNIFLVSQEKFLKTSNSIIWKYNYYIPNLFLWSFVHYFKKEKYLNCKRTKELIYFHLIIQLTPYQKPSWMCKSNPDSVVEMSSFEDIADVLLLL